MSKVWEERGEEEGHTIRLAQSLTHAQKTAPSAITAATWTTEPPHIRLTIRANGLFFEISS